MILNISIILCGLIIMALLTTFEAALVSSDPLKIYAQIKNKKQLKQMMSLFQNPSKIINSIIVAINFIDIMVALFVLKTFQLFFPIFYAGLYATIFSILFTLIFGEIFPKAIAITFPRFIIIHFLFLIQLLIFLMRPFVFLLNIIVKLFFPKLSEDSKKAPIMRSEVEMLFYQNRDIHSQQQLVQMVYRVLSIDNIRVKETKIPISEVVGFSQNMSVKEFKRQISMEYFSRVPIYDEDIFDIVGYVISKEILFCEDENLSIQHFKHKAVFFPENQPVDDVIQKLEAEQSPLAFVIDEFGAVAGMVTKKDLTEIILGGSLQSDEHNMGKGYFTLQNQDQWIVSGRQDIDELNDRLGLEIKKDGFEILSGFVMWKTGTIPKVGDTFIHNEFIFKVREMQGFFVSKVDISRVSSSKEEAS